MCSLRASCTMLACFAGADQEQQSQANKGSVPGPHTPDAEMGLCLICFDVQIAMLTSSNGCCNEVIWDAKGRTQALGGGRQLMAQGSARR